MGWNYIIGVRHTLDKEFKSKFNLDSFIKYEDVDQEKLDFALSLINNKLVKTNPGDAVEVSGLKDLLPRISAEIHGLTLRVRSNNNITVHKLQTDFEMDGDNMADYINTAIVDEDTRKKLIDSRINL